MEERLWKSGLTEPVQPGPHCKNGNNAVEGSTQDHTCHQACLQSRSPHVNGVLMLDLKHLQDRPGDVHSLETTMVRAHHSYSENNFCVVGCWTALWYGAAGIAWYPLHNAQCSELVADVTLF